jgi:hypothetical protein
MKVALCCIAKNEDKYIEEWLQYNLYLGFDHIFLYQNDWDYLIDCPLITRIQIDGIGRQEEAYNHFLKTYKDDYDWVAFFDIDEFLVLKQHKDIKQFLLEYIEYDGVGINWYLFGDNGNKEPNENYSVLERFTKRSKKMDDHIKSIVKTNIKAIYGTHSPHKLPIVDTKKNKIVGPFNKNATDEIAQLNHYFTKTWIEWQYKKNRGRANRRKNEKLPNRSDDDFHNHNFNEVTDTLALDFFKNKSTIF